ncbi:MAG TPA: tetratricopeptide repeat protein [Gemmatimonadaceae bacterium]|nr:tetratricopeptide repeat protein [Gemmatimonadaceae bacterium]
MPKFGKVAVLPAFAAALIATGVQTAAAQEKQCDIDENTTVSMAVFALMAAQQQGVSQADQTKQLQTAIGRMFPGDAKKEEQDNAKNPVGRAFTLGKIYMIYLSQPDMPVVTTRGRLGFKSNPEGAVDLSVGIDSAFKVVEQRAPECQTLISQWRQQAGWVRLVQSAMDFANSNKVDSADVVAHQALRISPTAPYSHLVLGNVAAQRLKNMEAIQHYKAALAEAEKDTVFNEVRRTILYTLGNFASDAGQIDTVAANKKIYFTEALDAFNALAKDPGKQYGDVASQGRTMVLRAMGDTAAIRAACNPQLQDPSGFSFMQLVQCGVTLAEIDDNANSTKLFEAASAMNPFHRDGLYNLARMQVVNGEFQKAIATTDKLVAVDPSNPDNYKLYVIAYGNLRKSYVNRADSVGKRANALGRTAADQARRRALTDTAIRLDSLQRAALNKQVEWNTKADSMPVQVLFAEFTPGPEKTTIAGEIRNRSSTEKSYVLNIEFLDKAGAVVGAGSATVDKVPANGTGRFSITGTAPGISAFRYKPLH